MKKLLLAFILTLCAGFCAAGGYGVQLVLNQEHYFTALPAWVLAVFMYFFIVWRIFGRDRRIKPLYPVYNPPAGVPPALAQRLWTTGGGSGTSYLSLYLISFAVKKCVKIEKEKTGLPFSRHYAVTAQRENISALDEREKEIFEGLFAGCTMIKLDGTYDTALKIYATDIEDDIKNKSEKYITGNSAYFTFGFLLAALFFLITGYINYKNIYIAGFMTALFTPLLFVNADLISKALLAFTAKTGGKFSRAFKALLMTLLVPVLYAAFVIISSAFFHVKSAQGAAFATLFSVCYIVLALVCGVFKAIMPSFTQEGRKLLGELAAFKQYLETGECTRIAASSPEAQAEIFCKYYPYAAAFGIAGKWNKHFENILDGAAIMPPELGGGLGDFFGGDWRGDDSGNALRDFFWNGW